MRFDVDTKASPELARRAFTDFTDHRPRIWNRTLDPRKYELRELGDTWAVAREGTAGSPFWVVVRYDWSDPGVIRWTTVESSYGGAGDGLVRITPGTGGGSHVHAEWENTGARATQRPLLFLLHLPPMQRLIARLWTTTLDRYAEHERP
ncbi:hypothetical protein Ade02nite_18140 [Paractinoplanes deccanensis]|uniref:Polyketide cyclase/dehydrase/lipid transport protein n=1 Tax=Paractinoplanes deccanensis TaxID=113561 RepID=A0ABQ3XZL4_9ACTN|nr:hypothetical protein [Actinoplanes deccanensis]GID73173.1 hypothetical protein Ade02nite_18140 [Actinoplanes deccanensis]